MSMKSLGNPYFFRIRQSEGRWTLSNAFVKSMKFIITGLCQAVSFSIICLNVNIWSLHDMPRLKPACSWRSWLSTATRVLSNRTLQNTLPGTESSVIPRQLSHSVRSPFFGSGMIIPFRQSDGTILLFSMLLHRCVSFGIMADEYWWLMFYQEQKISRKVHIGQGVVSLV